MTYKVSSGALSPYSLLITHEAKLRFYPSSHQFYNFIFSTEYLLDSLNRIRLLN